MIRCAALAWLAALGVVAAAAPAWGAPPAATLDGAWTGTLKVGRARQTGSATATMSETGGVVGGALTLATSDMSGTVTVSGTVRRGKARLAGVLGGQQLRWKGHWVRPRHAWRGTLVMHGGGHQMRGVLGLLRADGGPQVQCGADYFASDVMPGVFQPICSQCHVPGGLAERTRLRVTVGDPAATALSACGLIDRASPLESLLLLKPRGAVPHGGGIRLAPGSVEDQTLQHWIELVTAPGCGSGGNGGGTGNLYTDNCTACHGADARGVQGRPDIHCNRSIQDAVRTGRTGPAGIMPAFPTLADADIATIQAFLLGLCPTTTVTGSDLFAGNCATCHATDATGTSGAPSVRCATRVSDAVRVGRGPAMPSFALLADLEVALLETYLGGLCDQHGRTGTDLWSGNCASCHGASGRGGRSALGVSGPDVRCNRAIHDAVRAGNGDMPAFSAMSDPDVARVQGYLVGLCPPGTASGGELYASNCATCHGGDAGGLGTAPSVRCATRVGDAVLSGRGADMPSFPDFIGADLANLTGFLGQLCTLNGRTGADLYAGNCSSCHGATAHGGRSGLGVQGPDIRCTGAGDYQEKVRFGEDRMPAFPALGTNDVDAIVTFVHGAYCPGG